MAPSEKSGANNLCRTAARCVARRVFVSAFSTEGPEPGLTARVTLLGSNIF